MDQARGPERTGSYRVPALLYGSFPKERPAPPELPLHRWSSSIGTVFSRSGWERGSYFCVTMEPPGGGKVHADKGSFTFTSHGRSFAADPGVTFVKPQDHNTILIDGQGQYNSGGGSVADAIVRTCLSSGLADLTHMDIKPAYDGYIAYTRTRPGVVDWTRLRYGRGLPFRWATHAPVPHPDRYAVYVRGSVHPYVVIVDDIQKDDKPHAYQWLMHSDVPFKAREAGAAFVSRFSGTYYRKEKGSTRGVFQATVATPGAYSPFALMRKRPDRRNWFSHTITAYVNKKTVPYFRLGHYTKGWKWCPLGVHSLVAGANRVGIRVARGVQVAQVIAARDPAFAPQSALAADSTDPLVFAWESGDANGDWSARRDPQPRMDLHFFQPGAGGLKLDLWRKPRRVPECLRAQQTTVRAGFAALLVPHDADDPAPRYQAGSDGSGQATLAWGGLTDHLFADPAEQTGTSGSPIASDGRFAMVRTEAGKVTAYLLVAGTRLSFRGQALVRASAGPACAMNDGQTLQAQCPQGATVQALPLGVTRTVCNRREQVLRRPASATLELAAPVLAKTWKITFSPDRTVVYVAGDGPRPLKIRAPQAIKCVVNGVSVWYSRAAGGYLYPKLELTVPTHGKEPEESSPEDAIPLPDTGPKMKAVADVALPRTGWRFKFDPADAGRKEKWFDPALDDSRWGPIEIGDFWHQFGYANGKGTGWYRRTFELPARPAGAARVELHFGAVDELASVWLNGMHVGENDYEITSWTEPFVLDVGSAVRWGAKNQLTVRVENTVGAGGLYKTIDLRAWKQRHP